jgi:hypothetical protein
MTSSTATIGNYAVEWGKPENSKKQLPVASLYSVVGESKAFMDLPSLVGLWPEFIKPPRHNICPGGRRHGERQEKSMAILE